MNSKIITGIFAVIAIAAVVFGYMQKQEADFQKGKTNEMHREVVRLRQESEAARAEAAKLRTMIEQERARAEDAAEEAKAKTKKK
jgi:uncharacterized protein YlxW (UPF0749 family)